MDQLSNYPMMDNHIVLMMMMDDFKCELLTDVGQHTVDGGVSVV